MAPDITQTCCFTGHRPDKLPWGLDEGDPRCLAVKRSLARELDGLYRRGFRHFISGMAMGCDLYFAEAALEPGEADGQSSGGSVQTQGSERVDVLRDNLRLLFQLGKHIAGN